jgi:hypothetical protein
LGIVKAPFYAFCYLPSKLMTINCRTHLVLFLLIAATSLPAIAKALADTGQGSRACDAVVAHSNAGTLDRLIVNFVAPSEKTETFLRDRDDYGYVADVDINGDGKMENVVRVTQGTALISHLSIYDTLWRPVVTIEPNGEQRIRRSAYDIDLISYEGRTYILGRQSDELVYLSRVDTDHMNRLICEFKLSAKPPEELIHSSNDRLCRLAQNGKLNYAKFSHLHTLTHIPTNYSGYSQKAARIDINNDGTPEYVVQLYWSHTGGRGCDGTSLGVLAPRRDELESSLQWPMPDGFCGGGGGTAIIPFTYEGAVYIEGKYSPRHPVDYHEIAQLNYGILETVCRFKVRLIHEVIGGHGR